MMVEHVSIVEIVKDKQEEYEHIYKAFKYDDTNYSIFFTNHKHLFNIDLDHSKIRITPTLIERIISIGIICDKQKC